MKRNKNALNLAKAQCALDDIVLAIEVDYDLSSLEMLHILNTTSMRYLKYGVQREWEEDEQQRLDPGRQANGD